MFNQSDLEVRLQNDEAFLIKMERQRALEMEMSSEGLENFKARMAKAVAKGQGTKTPGIKLIFRASIEPLSKAIAEFVEEGKVAKRGRKHRALAYLSGMDAEVAAFLATKIVFDKLAGTGIRLQVTAMAIASALEDECRFRKFREANKGLFEVISEDLTKRGSNPEWRRTVLIHSMNKQDIEWTPWPAVDKLHLGQKLIDLLIRSTGLIKLVKRQIKKTDTEVFIEATEDTLKLVSDRNARCELLSPVCMPMIVPPKRWTNPFDGGYYFPHQRVPLVKSRNRNYLEELSNRVAEMPALYDAVNAIQETAWKINAQVLEVMRYVADNNLPFGSMPSSEPHPVPHCPKCGGAVDVKAKNHPCFEDEEVKKVWKRKTGKVYTANGKRKAKRMQVNKVLDLAVKFADEEELFFPMQYDFRGRIYCQPMFLTPQGADPSKGLLHFAHGKPIMDERAAGWLMIHGANTYGYDKVSLEERIEWTVSRTDDILAVAADPLTHTWWSDADKPWQFLAFCFDYAGFQAQGYGYVSHLPIALDGSCNGLQHFSAMLRDPIGGRAVNLLPSEKPNDIYQTVCDRMVEKLRHLIETKATATVTEKGVERVIDQAALAQQWLALKPNRSLTKRPVMVLPYGGTIFSCRDYVEEWLDENYGAGEGGGEATHPWGDNTKDALTLMSKTVWDSIGEVVVAARRAMDWLQKAARVAAAEGLPVTWATPDGFYVLQAYPEVDSKRIKTQLGDSVIKLTLNEELPTIDRRRQANGISPNYVHSMDASALRLYVTTAKENGINNFALIHDSYGTLAADTDLSVACLREAFVAMYQDENHLETLRQQLIAMLPEDRHEDIPPVPPMGSLDLELVRQADYFFA